MAKHRRRQAGVGAGQKRAPERVPERADPEGAGAEGEVDFVSALTDYDNVDFVEAIYGSRHDRFCNYRPFIRLGQTYKVTGGGVTREITAPNDGLIYCDTCGQQIGSLTPPSEYTCIHCGDPISAHEGCEGRCRIQDCGCTKAVRRGVE
jgi:hypothetical protein